MRDEYFQTSIVVPAMTQRTLMVNRMISWPYVPSGLAGLLTYVAFASLNDAWANSVLVGVALYIFLSIPLYSRLSNRLEASVRGLTGLRTGGRAARFALQLAINFVLLFVLVAGEVIDPLGLDGIGGFVGAATWVTVVSQGGQYAAAWLAAAGTGTSDRNTIVSVSLGVVVNALAVSGVAWIQPIYVGVSLLLAGAIFCDGVVRDVRSVRASSHGAWVSIWKQM